ncbi:MAG: ORF6N domain-containing protein [Firmicutes bacterium]|nr:ORF6N domain-containing protein [Bacillota bacterium]
MADDSEIIIVDEKILRSKIFIVRGQQVMLDSDLAEIYGYETKYFNRQVRNNIERFEGDDFMFRLTKDEFDDLRCKYFTSSWGGSRYLPYAFTEQGIYLLMTVLKGDLAVRQSRAIIRLFKSMKDYLMMNQPLLAQKNYFALVDTVEEHSREIKSIVEDIRDIKDKMVAKADLSDFMKLFDQGSGNEEILILDGEPFKADEAYQKIYRKAKRNITIIDDYIGTKTLYHLAHSKSSVQITIISDNNARPRLTLAEFQDFLTENPERNIMFLQSQHQCHDRYIVLDEGSKDMKIYHCGASSKDAGKKITTITRIMDMDEHKNMIHSMLLGPALSLR